MDGIFIKNKKTNMNNLEVKCFEFLIKLCTALTTVILSEKVKTEFPNRRMFQFKGCRRRVLQNNCIRSLL